MGYTPLHIMSSYTLLNSTITIPKLVKRAKDMGYTALALTDKHVMHGAVEFYKTAKAHGIKPIIGLTIDLSVSLEADEDIIQPMVLLAKNKAGYQSLLALSSAIMLHKEKITPKVLGQYTEDIITIIPSYTDDFKTLMSHESFLMSIEKRKDTYIGLDMTTTSETELDAIQAISKQLHLPLVVSEPVYHLDKEDAASLKVMRAIDNQANVDYQELSNGKQNANLKEEEAVLSLYNQYRLSEAVINTQKIADDCYIEFNWSPVLPKYKTPNNVSSEDFLKELAKKQLAIRVPNSSDNYTSRLEKELTTIIKMGFADYFLIVWDLMAYAHRNNIVTGSGRGSAAGSLVSYVLNITDVDPIKYNLLFDRFLNEERYSLPDIDLDFPDNKRELILEYVLNTYGSEHVAQIATFGTFAAKMAIRDTGRILGLTTIQLKQWSEAIPNQLGMTLKLAYKQSTSLRELVSESELNKTLFKIALSLEGLPRHVSTHAAGVVISKNPLVESTPLLEGNGHMVLTQFAMNDVEAVGLLKMDFLGLKNLTILADCLTNTPELKGSIKEKIDSIDLNDSLTLDLFKKGDTNGIFQFESSGIQNVLRKLEATTFEDIVAVNALYRPGPMEQIDTYINRKKGKEPIDYVHEDLKDIVGMTYGVMVYQEQVMKVASQIAGYTLAEADLLRRAISKKIKSEIDAGRKEFVAGAKQRGYTEETATQIYNHIERFANYGFNRSHAVSYSKLAFQLAYFKAHYPAAFFVSLMKASANNKDKLRLYMLEAKRRSIPIVPPRINESGASFTVKNQQICFGFDIIKGLRKDFIYHMINERRTNGPFKDLLSFINRIDNRWRKEQYLLPMIHAGCFDGLGENRNTLSQSLEPMLNSVTMSKGNIELFESLAPRYDRRPDQTLEEKLNQEYEATDFYLSGHPTEQYEQIRKQKKAVYLLEAATNQYNTYIVSITAIKKIQTKRGEPMAFVDIADSTGEATCILFPMDYRKYGKLIKDQPTILLEGKAEWKKGRLTILTSKLTAIEDMTIDNPTPGEQLFLRFTNLPEQKEQFGAILNILQDHSGQATVIIYDEQSKKTDVLKQSYNVSTAPNVILKIEDIIGKDNVKLKNKASS